MPGSTSAGSSSRSDVDLVERALQRPVPRRHERRVLLGHAVEPLLHAVELAGVLLPLQREVAQQPEDLVRRALEPEVVDRLAHDREHRVQRERRAEHDLVAHRVVDRVAVVLLHERVHLLVRDEQEQTVDGLVGRVEVAARR